MAEVLDITLNSRTFDMAEINSSVKPSAKYSSFGSGLMFFNGNTTTLRLSSVGCVGENAGGMKLFDRARSIGCKGHTGIYLQNQQLWFSV